MITGPARNCRHRFGKPVAFRLDVDHPAFRKMDPDYKRSGDRDRKLGALLGAAVGDALGVTYEFSSADRIPLGRFTIIGGGPFGFAPGEGSDDTDLLLVSLGAYQSYGDFDVPRAITGMQLWLRSNPPDVGNQTRKAIQQFDDGWLLEIDEDAQGNGGLMRAAAHAIACDDPQSAAANAASDTLLTHPSEFAARCSAHYAAGLWDVLQGHHDPDSASDGKFQPYDEPIADPGGHCLHSLRLALWALHHADSFEHGVDAIIRTGGDTDTNAMIAGALLGARFGVRRTPDDWLGGLSKSTTELMTGHLERLGSN